jgi:hypothetical protein
MTWTGRSETSGVAVEPFADVAVGSVGESVGSRYKARETHGDEQTRNAEPLTPQALSHLCFQFLNANGLLLDRRDLLQP